MFENGKNVYPYNSLDEIRAYYPHLYYVDLTQKLLDYKLKMLAKGKKGH